MPTYAIEIHGKSKHQGVAANPSRYRVATLDLPDDVTLGDGHDAADVEVRIRMAMEFLLDGGKWRVRGVTER